MDGGGNVTESFIDHCARQVQVRFGQLFRGDERRVAHCIGMAVFDHHARARTTWLSAMLEHYIAIVVVVQRMCATYVSKLFCQRADKWHRSSDRDEMVMG